MDSIEPFLFFSFSNLFCLLHRKLRQSDQAKTKTRSMTNPGGERANYANMAGGTSSGRRRGAAKKPPTSEGQSQDNVPDDDEYLPDTSVPEPSERARTRTTASNRPLPSNPPPPPVDSQRQTTTPTPTAALEQTPPPATKPTGAGSLSTSTQTPGATPTAAYKRGVTQTSIANTIGDSANADDMYDDTDDDEDPKNRSVEPVNLGIWEPLLVARDGWNFGMPKKLPGNITAPYLTSDRPKANEEGRKRQIIPSVTETGDRPTLASEIKLDFNSLKLINLLKDTGRMVKEKGQNTEYRAALELLRATAWCLHQTLEKLSYLKERREQDLVSISLFCQHLSLKLNLTTLPEKS